MKQTLTDQERNQLDQLIAEAEKRTGAQIVLAVIGRSDSYVELPWKAFAIGASVGGLLVASASVIGPEWNSSATVLTALISTLSTGGAAALLSVFVPQFAKLFLDSHRAEVEARQYAEALFLSRELFATSERTGILLMVSLFERQVVILPDTGLRKYLPPEALHGIIAGMTPALASGRTAGALQDGLKSMEDILASASRGNFTKNELPDMIIEEKGL